MRYKNFILINRPNGNTSNVEIENIFELNEDREDGITEEQKILFSENVLAYGVEWDTTAATTSMTRIGNLNLHLGLPLQRSMKRCLLLDNGSVNYYLSETDSTKKQFGDFNANLTGADGQVMVELPEFYIKFEERGKVNRVLISSVAIPGYIKSPKQYISAYEASLQRSTLKLSSVVNTSADFRGGNNNAANDALANTLLGMPATNISRTNFRTYARNRGSISWNLMLHETRIKLFWLYFIEFAEMNSQAPFTTALTPAGYKQGGLDIGVTDADSTQWNNFNGYNPFIPCGTTNSLGNKSGVVNFTIPTFGVGKTFKVPSYRGVENPFGHLWEWTDGINIKVQANDAGGESQIFTANSLNMSDVDYLGYSKTGLLSRASG